MKILHFLSIDSERETRILHRFITHRVKILCIHTVCAFIKAHKFHIYHTMLPYIQTHPHTYIYAEGNMKPLKCPVDFRNYSGPEPAEDMAPNQH